MIREWLETPSGRDRKGANRGRLSHGSTLPKIHGADLRIRALAAHFHLT